MQKNIMRQSTAGYIVKDANRLLLVQPLSYGDNMWAFPGGGVKEGESHEQALLREIFEEVGLTEAQLGKITKSNVVYSYPFPQSIIDEWISEGKIPYSGQDKHQFLIEYTGEESDIKLKEDEIKRYTWINITKSEIEKHLIFKDQAENALKTLEEFAIEIKQ